MAAAPAGSSRKSSGKFGVRNRPSGASSRLPKSSPRPGGGKSTQSRAKVGADAPPGVPIGPSVDHLANALGILGNNKTVSVLETKDGSRRTIAYDPGVVAALRAMFPMGKIYPFRLAGTVIPYPTDGSGNILATTSFSPAVASFPEWAGCAALFDEVVLVKARWTLVGGASALKNIGIVVGYNPNNVSNTPATTTAVANLSDSECLSSYSTTPRILVKSVRIPKGRAWAETTIPAVASPPAGCVGSIDMANGGASGTVSSNYFYAFLEIVVKFRNRI